MSCKMICAVTVALIIANFAQSTPTYTLPPNNPNYKVVGTDQCSQKLDLLVNLTMFGETFSSLYVCVNGYISLGSAAPDILVEPDEFSTHQTSTIMAILLMQQPANMAVQFSQGFGFFESENGLYDGTIKVVDPYFDDDYQFIAFWGNLPGTPSGDWMRLIVTKDNDYAGTGKEKIHVIYQYGTLPINQDATTGQYARAGVSAPNNTQCFELPYSGTSQAAATFFSTSTVPPYGIGYGRWFFTEGGLTVGAMVRPGEGTTTTTTSAAPQYTTPNLPQYVVIGKDQCSEKIDLLETLPMFGQNFSALYMCANGYMSLGCHAPEILIHPDDFFKVQSNAIIAPLLIRQGDNYAGQFTQGHGFFESENGLYEGTILAVDPFFNDDYQFVGFWSTLWGTGPENWMRIALAMDKNYAGTGNVKIILYYQYATMPLNQDSATGQYVRAGINTPNNASYFELPDSGTVNAASTFFSSAAIPDYGIGGGRWFFTIGGLSAGEIVRPGEGTTNAP